MYTVVCVMYVCIIHAGYRVHVGIKKSEEFWCWENGGPGSGHIIDDELSEA